jgi:diadenosine tetraphosphate (Ap4A) HIT family hydrolase
MNYDPENIFAKILDGAIPCQEIDQDETTLSFEDINPQAPIHCLVIPKGAYTDLSDFAARASDAEIADWVRALARVATKKGVDDSGYRIIVNSGENANQEVPHLHGHVLGGKALGPMLR